MPTPRSENKVCWLWDGQRGKPDRTDVLQPDWLKALAVIYKTRRPVVLVDDAGLGIDPANYTLLQMAREAGLSRREMAGLGVALGMSATGIGMVVLAFLDPNPPRNSACWWVAA